MRGDSAFDTLQWCVHASAFGPNAWFELSVKAKQAKSRRLRVNKASFGGNANITLDFLFQPHIAFPTERPSIDLAGGTFIDFWLLSLTTDLWRDNKNAQWKSDEIRFGDFVLRKKFLHASPSPAYVKMRLSEMFDGRVDSPVKANLPLDLAFLPDCVWLLSRGKKVAREAAVTSFSGRISAAKFTFGWYGVEAGTPFFMGFARPKDRVWLNEPYFRLGETDVEISNIESPMRLCGGRRDVSARPSRQTSSRALPN
jgi:hypothetical protein